jgi:hypothetical protein
VKIELGKSFYRYITPLGVFHYIVKGIRQYGDSELYELECQTCKHGWKCLLLASLDDYGKLQYVRMLNDDEYESQKHFHMHSGQFHERKEEAMISQYKTSLKWYNDKIGEFKNNIKTYEDKVKEIDAQIKTWEEIVKN